ncbi:flagellin [Desulfurispira natronophila]|uniref:Flagellin n=1 Tax=Desulfurispira natronophila TaxID=682562 RepID=A0A7W7Y634_9BACT|nr:flagellin [Desulfurispira natronophila]MBB5022795.1 flagellin [Desulfurispira natronophila]
MSMSVLYNNIPSLNAQNNLRVNSNSLSNSIERLSSGMRINRASDDASGLAISEKMRGQISGLDRAVSNAQDGISLIQTAEAALNETTAILQRMRELAIQAGNGTMTSDDRQHVQREVDQLKNEIDRISTSTEFNTKKLLNGDATARWSTSNPNLMEAIVRDRVVSGNYQLDVNARVGQNQVLKSNIMALRDGAFAGDILTNQGVGSVLDANDDWVSASRNESGIAGIYAAEGVRTGDLDERQYRMSVMALSGGATDVNISGQPNGQPQISAGAVMGFNGSYQQAGSNWTIHGTTIDTDDAGTKRVNNGQTTMSAGLNVTGGMHGYMEIEFVKDFHIGSASGSIDGAARARFIDVKTGEPGAWATIDMTVNSTGGHLVFSDGTVTGKDRLGDVESVFGGPTFITLGTGDSVKTGDKGLFSVDALVDENVLEGTMSVGGGMVKIDERHRNDINDDSIVDRRGAFLIYTAENGLQNTAITDGNKQVSYHLAQLDSSTGSVTIGNIELDMNPSATGTQTDDIVNAEIRGTGGLASSHTRLRDIEAFITPDGTNVFDSAQKLTIYGNGKSADIYLEGNDTIARMEDKFTKAITKDLGISMGDVSTDNRVADFVAKGSAVENSDAAVEGTMVLRSLFNGAQGEMAVVANQPLLDALNLDQVQESKENIYNVTVRDAHTGRPLGSDVVGDGVMKNVIQGVDVSFLGNIGINASFSEEHQKFQFEADDAPETMFLHLVDSSMSFQIGANEGQTMRANIAQIDVKSLGLEHVTMISQELAQASVGTIDEAITRVSTERAKMGALSNRLDHTINSLNIASENLQAAESRIRDTNVAKEMSNFTLNQMLTQAAQSMLAQANSMPQGIMQLLG